MRFTTVFAPLALFALSAYGHINGIVANNATYKATATSKYPITLSFTSGPINYDTFSVALGVRPVDVPAVDGSVNDPFATIDIWGLGDSGATPGTKTYKVPLPDTLFTEGSGQYVITAGVFEAVGINWGLVFHTYNTTITVNVK